MKKPLQHLTTSISLIILLVVQVTSAQWTPTAAVQYRENISTFCSARNGTLFAGTTDKGVIRSMDNGKTWTIKSAGLPINYYVYSMVSLDSVIIVTGLNGSLYRSIDQGDNWNSSDSGISDSTVIRCFMIQNKQIYTGTSKGLYLSDNYGLSWNLLTTIGLPANADVTALAVWKNVFLAAVKDSGLYILPNRKKCESIQPELEALGRSISDISINGESVYINSYEYLFPVSIDSGDTWSWKFYEDMVYRGPNGPVTCPLPFGDQLLIGTSEGLYITANNSSNWQAINCVVQSNKISVITSNNGRLIVSTDREISFSDDSGKVWNRVNTGLWPCNITAITANGEYLFALTEYGDLFRSRDQGMIWNQSDSGLPVITNLGLNDSCIFGASWYGRVFRSKDNGASWENVSPLIPALKDLKASNNCVIISGTSMKRSDPPVYISKDNGTSWVPSFSIQNASIMSNGNLLGNGQGFISLSTDTGLSWHDIKVGETWISRSILLNKCILVSMQDGTIYRSTDNGTSWNIFNNGLPPNTTITLFYFLNSTILAATPNGIFASTENDSAWRSLNYNLKPGTSIISLSADAANLYAATPTDGIWRMPFSSTTIPRHSTIPKHSQATVFTSGTNVSVYFSLSILDIVKIDIIDLKGQKIGTIINCQLGSGTHTLNWKTDHLSNGHYFITIQTKNFFSVKPINIVQ